MASNSMTDTETTTIGDDTAEADTTTTGATTTGSASTEAEKGKDADTSAAPTPDAADGTSSGTTPEPKPAGTAASGSFVTGALGLVSAGLGLASLTGTSIGDMMRARQELLGQITAATGGQIDQIDALYGSPWSTVALVNGTIAVLAVIVGAVVLGVRGRAAGTPNWVKAVALGGTVLGVIGLLVSLGMYFDLFAAAPQLPAMPGMPGMPG